jgi:hypothetical protein
MWDVETRISWLNSLLTSLDRLFCDLGYNPGTRPFCLDGERVAFGQIVLLDNIVICCYPVESVALQWAKPPPGAQIQPLWMPAREFRTC